VCIDCISDNLLPSQNSGEGETTRLARRYLEFGHVLTHPALARHPSAPLCQLQLREAALCAGHPGLLSWPNPRSAPPLVKVIVERAGSEVWPQFSPVSSS